MLFCCARGRSVSRVAMIRLLGDLNQHEREERSTFNTIVDTLLPYALRGTIYSKEGDQARTTGILAEAKFLFP